MYVHAKFKCKGNFIEVFYNNTNNMYTTVIPETELPAVQSAKGGHTMHVVFQYSFVDVFPPRPE